MFYVVLWYYCQFPRLFGQVSVGVDSAIGLPSSFLSCPEARGYSITVYSYNVQKSFRMQEFTAYIELRNIFFCQTFTDEVFHIKLLIMILKLEVMCVLLQNQFSHELTCMCDPRGSDTLREFHKVIYEHISSAPNFQLVRLNGVPQMVACYEIPRTKFHEGKMCFLPQVPYILPLFVPKCRLVPAQDVLFALILWYVAKTLLRSQEQGQFVLNNSNLYCDQIDMIVPVFIVRYQYYKIHL